MDAARLNQRIVAGFAWQGVSKVVVQTASWVSTILVARLLHPADYGIMAVASVFVYILVMVMEFGLSQGLIQKSATSTEEEDAVFWLSLVLGGVLYGVLFFAAPYIAVFYGMPPLEAVLKIAGFTLVLGSLKVVPVALAMRLLDFRYRSLVEISATFVSVATVLPLALSGYGVWALVWGLVAQTAATALGYLPLLARFPKPRFRFAMVSEVLTFGLRITGANVAYVVSSKADVFIIGKVLGEKFTGYYALAFQLATIPLDKIGTVFNHVAFPALSRAKDDDALSRKLFLDFHRYLLTLCYPILFGIAVVAEDAVVLLLTEKWLPIVPVLQVLCVISALRISGMLMTPVLNGRGKVHLTLRYSVAGMIVLPIAFFIGVQYGLLGVAYAWLVVYPLLYLMLLRYLLQDLALSLATLVWSVRSTLLASSVMVAAVLLLHWNGGFSGHWERLLASVAIGGASYLGIFGLFFRDDFAGVWRVLARIRRRKAMASASPSP